MPGRTCPPEGHRSDQTGVFVPDSQSPAARSPARWAVTGTSRRVATPFLLPVTVPLGCRTAQPGQNGCSHVSAQLSADTKPCHTCHTCHLPLCHCSSLCSRISEQATASLEAVQLSRHGNSTCLAQGGCRQAQGHGTGLARQQVALAGSVRRWC